jgi:6-phosphogluconate dehydrogenase
MEQGYESKLSSTFCSHFFWFPGDLDSYLIEITRDIFSKKDEETGKYIVDLILDVAGQKVRNTIPTTKNEK